MGLIPGMEGMLGSKLAGWDELLSVRARCAEEGKRVVWTNGCFDLLHPGHVRSLESARRLGDVLVVGLNSDTSVRQLKGVGRPILSELERVEVLSGLSCVDYVMIFAELRPDAALLRLKPDIHCKGAEYAPPHGKPIPEMETVHSYGGRIEFLPYSGGISTTELIRRIREA
ncbi:MAG TPA: adenylyltransferase/cytidyltransferase family protein [Nitrospira sp.]|nr:adenylyltransferase/cytidyltransferase family protein [Nitrospira sp.]